MKIAIKDLEHVLEYARRRSTDTDMHIKELGSQLIITFFDVDNNQITMTLYEAAGGLKARVSQQDYLDVAVKNLKKP